jgi:hypothetical protein
MYKIIDLKMNRKLEQRHMDILYKMTHCVDLRWECNGYNISLEFPHSGHSFTIYMVTTKAHDASALTQKTILTNDYYVTEFTWKSLKKGFDEWRKLEGKMNNSIAYNYEKAKATLKGAGHFKITNKCRRARLER